MAITRPGEPEVGRLTTTLRHGGRMADNRSMAALPTTLPSAPTAAQLAAQVDAKLNLARRLRAQDAARRATSVAPPSRSVA